MHTTVQTTKMKPCAIHETVQNAAGANDGQLQNLQQVQHMSSTCACADREARGYNGSSKNLADNFLILCNCLSANDPFIPVFLFAAGHTQSIILYTFEKINDIRKFCCKDAHSSVKAVLGIDWTFNLLPLFVTVTVYTIVSPQQCPLVLLFPFLKVNISI